MGLERAAELVPAGITPPLAPVLHSLSEYLAQKAGAPDVELDQ
jgi:hypothetical protein